MEHPTIEIVATPPSAVPEPVKATKQKQSKKKVLKAPQPVQQEPVKAEQPADDEQNSHRATLSKHLRKTRFCMYHLQGACQFGSECSFAHALSEMHQTPDLTKTQLCKAWAEGNCSRENCMFAHGDDELRSTDMFYKKTLCIWNEKGKCRNGEKCRFAHGMKQVRPRSQGDVNSIPPAAGKSEGKGQQRLGKGKGAGHPAVGGSADPMQINPGDLMLAAASMPTSKGAPLRLPEDNGHFSTSATGGHDLNVELSQLCQSIAVLTAQCSNIQKRMQLEAEFNDIQQQAASLAAVQQQATNIGLRGPQCRGYQNQRGLVPPHVPCPPGLSALSAMGGAGLGFNQDELTASMAAALEGMNSRYACDYY